MADRRMLAKTITENDNFVALPAAAQALYMHLTMSADDDGFCNQVSTAMFRAHAKKKDLEALVEARYLLRFENGVMVIKHWRMANSLRKDRHAPTVYQEELQRLTLKKNGAYTLATEHEEPDSNLANERQPDGNQTATQYRLGKDSIGKDNTTPQNARMREEEPENDLGRVMSFFMDKVNATPSPFCVDMLKNYTETLGAGLVLHAIGVALDEHKYSWRYIQAILQNYSRSGFKTIEDVLLAEQEFKARKGGNNGGNDQASGKLEREARPEFNVHYAVEE